MICTAFRSIGAVRKNTVKLCICESTFAKQKKSCVDTGNMETKLIYTSHSDDEGWLGVID